MPRKPVGHWVRGMWELDLGALLATQVPFSLPGAFIERRNILNVATTHGFRARNGIAGQADYFVVLPGGLHIELELKAARGALRERQEAWRTRCQTFEVPHLVLRAGRDEEPDATVARWIEELRAVVARQTRGAA